jgi:ATP-dependent DNA ligase
MTNILSILNELANDPSGNAKKAILQREKGNELLKRVFVMAYDPFLNFYIKKIPAYKQVPDYNVESLTWALDQLSALSTRKVTGNAGIAHLLNILEYTSTDDSEVIERIVERDLRVGCGESTANKVWENCIPTFDVMLAHQDCSGIKFPCYGQTKMDGLRANLVWDGVEAKAYTRNGKVIETHGQFDKTFSAMGVPAGTILDGEIVCYRDGKALDRKTSNGIGNKGIKGTISQSEAELMRMIAWDIPGVGSYKDRFSTLNTIFKKLFDAQFDSKILLIESRNINTMEEAELMFGEMLAKGEEGIILKNINAPWVPKRSKDLGKMKAELDADLIVVAWEEGKGKYEGLMGALVCETSDGKVRVNVGTGFDDAARKELTEDKTVGRIITVMYNAKITKKDSDIDSLFLPRFVEFRNDKDVANSSDEVK